MTETGPNIGIYPPRAVLNRRQRQTRRTGHRPHPTMAQRTSRRTAHHPSLSLIQMRLSLIQMRQNLTEKEGQILISHSERSQHARKATPREPQTADTIHDEPQRVTRL